MDCEEPEKLAKQDLDDSGCVQDALTDYKRQVQLLDLCDDVLLYILKHCSPHDLKALGHTCLRLGSLVCDHTLWTSVDCRAVPVGVRRLRWLLTHCLTDGTTQLQLKGFVDTSGQKCMGLNQEGPGSCCSMVYDDPGVSKSCPFWPENIEKMKQRMKKHANAKTDQANSSSLLNLSSKPDIRQDDDSSRQNADRSRQNADSSRLNTDSSRLNTDSSCQNSILFSREDVLSNDSECESSVLNLETIVNSKFDCPGPCFTLDRKLLQELSVRCSNLTTLALEYCNLDYLKTKISQFPPKLKKLSLRGTRIFNLPYRTSFLCKINKRLPDLEDLDVSECEWLEASALMALSKLCALRRVAMRSCVRLAECVAYSSLAARYGFKQLQVLDVRESLLADSEMSAFGWLPLLQELYASPPTNPPDTDIHTHTLDDISVYQELEPWEIAEPDYYKNKIAEPIVMEEEEKIEETVPPPEQPWQSERIIVIPGPVTLQLQRLSRNDLQNVGPINLSPNRPIVPQVAKRQHDEPSTSGETKKNGERSVVTSDSEEDEPKAKKIKVNNQNGEGSSSNANGESQSQSSSRSGEGQVHFAPNGEGGIRIVSRVIKNCAIGFQLPELWHRAESNIHNRAQDQFALGPNLVTDLAIMRFGRADNDNINYVQIGRNEAQAMPNEIRPDRSSLRILSMTGYRNISDRSLVHLATAAPNLMSIDFSRTNVSERGVSTFKALRPDCEVVYSKYQDK